MMTGCGISKSSFSPDKKYSPKQLQRDYAIYQTLLEESHPGLYWYTSKDSMDHYFQEGAAQLKDSMTEPEFRRLLTYTTSRINCGHTTVRSSRLYSNYQNRVRSKLFPLNVKAWEHHYNGNDTVAVTTTITRPAAALKRGTVIRSINGKPVDYLITTMFDYISTDGYNRTHKYQSLSNLGNFGTLYTSLFGLSEKYVIDYIDSTGRAASITIPVYNPEADTATRNAIRRMRTQPQPSRQERRRRQLASARLLRIDSTEHTAFMELNSFARGYHLKKFFRQSFRELKRRQIHHLVIDVRTNGGGSVTNSTLLTRFIADGRFRIADSLYALRRKSTYGRYVQNDFFNRLFMTFLTKKSSDGHYHFGYFERHYFKPKKKNHYQGKTYILTGGNSFSATTLFTSSVIKQDNVTVVGEETGGGAYGNTAWLIPDVTLPETGIRFRLPLFRLVIDKNIPKDGRGVQPEVEALPTLEAIRKNEDFKLNKALELIKADKEKH